MTSVGQYHPSTKPLVSIVTPLYNGEKFIELTLNSILSQTFQNYEVIIVDDGSSDAGSMIVQKFVDKYPSKFRIITHPDKQNHGVASSRNLAIKNAIGVYIAFLDQDDIWLPEKLMKQITAIERSPDASLVYSKVVYIDELGQEKKIAGIYPTYGKGDEMSPVNVFSELIKEDFIPNLTVLAEKSCIERVGMLDEGPRYEYEDWLLLCKLAYFNKFIFIPEVLGKWREHKNNFSSNIFTTGKYRFAEEHATISLFTFLINDSNVKYNDIRHYLRMRIRRLLFRARSWGASMNEMREHRIRIIKAFPREKYHALLVFAAAICLPPAMAAFLRRVRRYILGT